MNSSNVTDDDLDQRPYEDRNGTGEHSEADDDVSDDIEHIKSRAANRRRDAQEDLKQIQSSRRSLEGKLRDLCDLESEITGRPVPPPPAKAGEHPVDTISGVKVRGGTRGLLPAFEGTKLRAAGPRKRKAKAPKVTKAPGRLSLSERFIAHLREHPKSSNLSVAEALGIPQQRAASKANELKRAGKIKKHGKGKKITWSVV